ncbi:MAG: UDP-N-acetylmuramate--L-alanine ligase [Actinobacteria bacterium]|nr:UDP-N-acetylmuramate--L-alanine ligase [Actinomycetota bacterium]MSW30795.1 UDP-N-acetylmuramate--L-alanine ligase [Actinomycetota bacterium]MSY14244.1 UDP-N-acetylmuramate--L-alanine ligase [Actinomycetota bacterium]
MAKELSNWQGKRLHFIGIGGAGMSGLARIALSHGITVSGSDAKDSTVLSALGALGAEVHASHLAQQVNGADFVIFSTAINQNNVELIRAHELKLPILTRAQALATLMSNSRSIAVAGTHGKTTTSSMLTVALQACGLDPSFAIGGTLTSSGSNAHRGTGELFVAEADESDGSFIEYRPFAAIVTNVEHDHVDYFATEADVTQAFADFAATIAKDGYLIYCADDSGSAHLASSVADLKLISYGTSVGADLFIDSINLLPLGSTARILWKGRAIGNLSLQVPGLHNVLNAGAALAMGLTLGAPAAEMLTGLASFHGTGRRFELKATIHGIRIVDDYGHHPTEIQVTLSAAKRYAGDGRLIVIFQPHRYSRTKAFMSEFAKALSTADEVVLLEVYAASEVPIPGITSETIVEQMSNGHFIPNFLEASEWVIAQAKPGDVILTLGAGDVNSLASIISDGLARRFN